MYIKKYLQHFQKASIKEKNCDQVPIQEKTNQALKFSWLQMCGFTAQLLVAPTSIWEAWFESC